MEETIMAWKNWGTNTPVLHLSGSGDGLNPRSLTPGLHLLNFATPLLILMFVGSAP